MNLNDYSDRIAGFAKYPAEIGLRYARLGLIGEAGEIANQVKKIWRDDAGLLSVERGVKLQDELGDVVWYATRLAHHMGVGLADITPVIGDTEVFDILGFAVTDVFTATERLLLVTSVALAMPTDADLEERTEYVQEVFNAVADMADYLGTDIDTLADQNVAKLDGRVERGTLQGSGDGR